MVEMVIPGTYITVRAEGLISTGGVATGIVGVVGTASSGPVNIPVTLSGFANAREVFGQPDDFDRPEGAQPLTLVRGLEHIYNNGASTVVAVRVAGASNSNASFSVRGPGGNSVALLTARTPGTWGNYIGIGIGAAEDECRIENEVHDASFDKLDYNRIVPSGENRIRLTRGITRRSQSLDIVYKRVAEGEEVRPDVDGRFQLTGVPVEAVASVNQVQILGASGNIVRTYGDGSILYGDGAPPGADEIRINTATGEITFEAGQVPAAAQRVLATYAVGRADPIAGQVLITAWDGSLDYAPGEAPQQADGDTITADYLVHRDNCVQVTLTHDATSEHYVVPAGRELARRVNASSTLATATAEGPNVGNLPAPGVNAYFGTGSNAPGSNGAEAGPDEHAAGLESLSGRLINIVVLAGQDANTMGSVLLGHLNATEQTDHERIGVIGASGSSAGDFLGHSMADDRVVLVAPGIRYPDGRTLPPAYTAAAVAGLISSLPVQTSLTNKPLNVPGIAEEFNRGQQAQLIRRNVLSVIPKNGYRVLKGITTEGEGMPFSAIPTRRIVDYAKYGVRSGSEPYLGRLNNSRVRAALKATLDGFLTRMVEGEQLTGYTLEVSATRAQEIAGIVSVIMTLQPTFSINFIRVVMNLQ